jgi:hypothetical protein
MRGSQAGSGPPPTCGSIADFGLFGYRDTPACLLGLAHVTLRAILQGLTCTFGNVLERPKVVTFGNGSSVTQRLTEPRSLLPPAL